ncbi:AraC family transcriptional regulator [Marinitenerispora sediminis]|uniref:AraC family transcriptional regulator n=1 Tax=Marinitenerispora sediminis TaxID=1931232 RepID=A0A368T026_9ACTN|nr:AraC family transcriptional regulator [Marinitenerispora sediminis]RCV51449.1 AraC family transcriptional regulator [Marinitenerispora sediminis]RCV51905.1 AraC family transcriptional regulator [Marinitenerispora sediminis]RCV55244.1 AraC family transcriptional regulator [Marinitenerispora sediminis]
MAEDWTRYWRSPDLPLEAMHAHFERHVYHRHSHDGYSFGVTESGAQAFRCRGAARTSAAGMVMAFNPDDPHDGRAADALGFTYRIVHIGPEIVADVLGDAAGGRGARPLFAEPVVHDPVLAGALRRLHTDLLGGAGRLRREESLTAAVLAMVRRGATRPPAAARPAGGRETVRIARRVRALLVESGTDEITAADLAAGAGCSRFAAYRAFHAVHGMAPSGYQRLLRLRAARRMLGSGTAIAEAAARAGFADQSHLTRWFTRCYGITPGTYRAAAAGADGAGR